MTMAKSHISDAIRADLAKLGPEKRNRVLDVADERRPLADDRRAGAPPDVASRGPVSG